MSPSTYISTKAIWFNLFSSIFGSGRFYFAVWSKYLRMYTGSRENEQPNEEKKTKEFTKTKSINNFENFKFLNEMEYIFVSLYSLLNSYVSFSLSLPHLIHRSDFILNLFIFLYSTIKFHNILLLFLLPPFFSTSKN